MQNSGGPRASKIGTATESVTAQKEKEERETCRTQTDNLCLKLLEMAPQMHPDLDLKNRICMEVESLLRVEACYLLK